MKILVLSNLYPPHHAGTYEFRCQTVVESLKLRGHEVHVLTSNHGLKSEEISQNVWRRLLLNNVYGYPKVSGYNELKGLEVHNHQVLKECLSEFQPEVVYVWSLHGLSKSLIFALQKARYPTVYDVADAWLADELKLDPWLDWWNRAELPFPHSMLRKSLELSGQRDSVDELAPTRHLKEVKRLPHLYGGYWGTDANTIMPFKLDYLYFCSNALRNKTIEAGFPVQQSEVIYPGIPARNYWSDVKPAEAPVRRFLIFRRLHRDSGVGTAIKALKIARDQDPTLTLDVVGEGDSNYIAQLRSLIAQSGGLPVEFLTVSDPARDMPAIYRNHDAFLETAEWEEPFDSIHLEAMAAGLPIIGTICGGTGETLQNGVNALTYTAGSADELAAHMLALGRDSAMRRRIATLAQEQVLHYFNESGTITRIEQILIAARDGELTTDPAG